MKSNEAALPMLEGIRVVDLTRLLPGPYATWLLASMGAEVIKVEQPGRGDYIRQNWPRRGGTATVFHLYNRGKRSVAVDLKKPAGRDALLDLARSADVIVDGNRPGVLDALGCGWSKCRLLNDSLVWCAITGFGQEGPYARRVGHDVNYLSLAGVLSGLRGQDGKPVLPRVTIADMAGGGLMALGGILGALLGVVRSGAGRFVDVSMTDSVLSMQGLRVAEELAPGDARPAGDLGADGDDTECGVYETADGRFVSIDPYENRFKDRLWALVEQAGYGRRPPRGAGRHEVREELRRVIASRPRDAWVELLDGEEVCFAPVYELDEVVGDPHIAQRGSLGDVMDPTVKSPSMGSPIRFSPPVPRPRELAAPALGEHTLEVMTGVGWSLDKLELARSQGAVFWPTLSEGLGGAVSAFAAADTEEV